ncbi:hypothetical protein ABES74_03980 [Bacillus subtilis]
MMLRLDRAVVRLIGTSYKEASELIAKGGVRINGRVDSRPWRFLNSGYYFVKVHGHGSYKFAVKGGNLTKIKRKVGGKYDNV